MDRRSSISPPGTTPPPAQSNETHLWPYTAAHLNHSSSSQCFVLLLQASMHLRPSSVDNYGWPSRPTHSSSANRAQQGDRHQYQLSCPLPLASSDNLDRSFPYCVLSCWNSLPVNTIRQHSYLKGMQRFKTMVYIHLLHKNWMQSTDLS